MRVELKQLHERARATTIYVTHDQTEAMTMASRVVVMRGGVIQQVGSPLAIYDRPGNRFVASFLGSPGMNFIPCNLVREAAGIYAVGRGFRLRLPSDREVAADVATTNELVLGIRSEDIVLDRTEASEPETGTLTAEIVAIEPLGNATYVTLRFEGQLLTAVTPPHMALRVHDARPVRFNMAKSHLFRADPTGTSVLGS
jgi:ABC-type sugar transport system ATPase subunit